MLKIYENFDLVHITFFRFNFRIKCKLLFQYLLVEVVEGLFCLGDDDFAALDQFYLLNNV